MTKSQLAVLDDLPVPVYVVLRDGRFLYGNRLLCTLLDIEPPRLESHNITSFYANAADRAGLMAAAEAGETLEKRVVTFNVKGRPIQVQMFCRALGSPPRVSGFMGALVEVTSESEVHRLFESHLSVGVYKLDAEDRIVFCNLAFARMHGFDDIQQILNMSVRSFYVDEDDADRIKRRIIEMQALHRERVDLRRRNGSTFVGSLTAIPFFVSGAYAGRGGVIVDITEEGEYARLSEDIPVGFYVVRHRDGKDIIVDCNEEFAKIHEVASRQEMLGRDVRQFHFSSEDSERFLERVARVAREGGVVLGDKLRIRTAGGAMRIIEINSRPQLVDNQVIGRTGAIRDITAEVEMQEQIAALTSDLGAAFHIFRQTTLQLKHSIGAVTDVLARQSRARNRPVAPAELAELVREPLAQLAGGCKALLLGLKAAERLQPLPPEAEQRLAELRDTMMMCAQKVPEAHWRDVWRAGAVEVQEICNAIRPQTIAHSLYRPVAMAADAIGRLTALATLSVAREAIEAVDAPIVALRDQVTSGTRVRERREFLAIEACVVDAIASVTAFADERLVHLDLTRRARAHIVGDRSEIVRAIGNVLHNAIKYSWSRESGRTWVGIGIVSGPSSVTVEIENWGVPVPHEEIQDGLVFRLGFRGRFSSDRGRIGTGVGLADSMAVVRAHHGSLRIESRPADPHGDARDYKQPFITKVSLELPFAGALKGGEER